ncbi:MAG: 50S ribosomal protein L11 [Nanoarchaeota archaeon]
MQIKLLIEGGDMQPGPALSQKLGPAGINIGQVIQKVNEATKNFKGMKVPVEVEIDSAKNIEVIVFSPPVAELLKKELGIEKGSGLQKKTKMANASIEQIISVSKTKLPNLLSRTLKTAVKSVLGSCMTLGILVENKDPREVIRDIEAGKYDKEINEEITETPKEKKKSLEEFFSKILAEQEKIRQQEEAAKAAAEAAAATTTPEAGKEGEAKTAATTETKTEEKKPEEKAVKGKAGKK